MSLVYQFQIPPPLALRWNIIPHSAVRIKPVKSAIKVASLIRLQPLIPLVSLMCEVVEILKNEVIIYVFVRFFYLSVAGNCQTRFIVPHSFLCMPSWTFSPQPQESEEETQTAFLDWLHTQSHEPLACLTPRSGNILLHGADGDSFFFHKSFYKSADGT